MKSARLLPLATLTALLPLTASAAVVVNDSSWTTPVPNTMVGDSSGINYWGSSGSTGSLSLNGSNQLVLTQGGRGLLANFSKQTLAGVGDSLAISFTFALSVDSGAGQLSFGVFDNTLGTAITANGYGNTPAAATDYTGYLVGAAANSTSSTTTIYERNATANLTASLNTTNATSLGSTGAPTVSNPTWTANTFYTSTLVLTRVETGLQLSYSHSADPSYTLTVIDTTPSYDFTTLEFRGNSALFGTGQTLTLSNLNITFTPASAIPEPSSFAALAGLATLGLAATRRRRA